jgi:hypothetical protein
MADAPMTVVETARFLKDARPLLSDCERAELVAFIGANPEAGQRMPVFLLAAYAKNEKANLTPADRNAMKRLVPMLVAGYPRNG